MEEVGRQNMAMLERAMSLFSPFYRDQAAEGGGTPPPGTMTRPEENGSQGTGGLGPGGPGGNPSDAEMAALRAEVAALRGQLAQARAITPPADQAVTAPAVAVPTPIPVPAPPAAEAAVVPPPALPDAPLARAEPTPRAETTPLSETTRGGSGRRRAPAEDVAPEAAPPERSHDAPPASPAE
jgi:hypothetical protein